MEIRDSLHEKAKALDGGIKVLAAKLDWPYGRLVQKLGGFLPLNEADILNIENAFLALDGEKKTV